MFMLNVQNRQFSQHRKSHCKSSRVLLFSVDLDLVTIRCINELQLRLKARGESAEFALVGHAKLMEVCGGGNIVSELFHRCWVLILSRRRLPEIVWLLGLAYRKGPPSYATNYKTEDFATVVKNRPKRYVPLPLNLINLLQAVSWTPRTFYSL
jgi:hypothetical protein